MKHLKIDTSFFDDLEELDEPNINEFVRDVKQYGNYMPSNVRDRFSIRDFSNHETLVFEITKVNKDGKGWVWYFCKRAKSKGPERFTFSRQSLTWYARTGCIIKR